MKYLSLIIILVFAFILRIINLNQSLWWDEAISVVYAMSSDFWWFVTKYPIGDFHPPGYFALLWVWGHLFGFSEISVRLPSLIFGLLTIYMTFLIGKELFSKKVGLLAALFLTVAPLHIYYSQEARMYSLAAFAVASATFFLIKLIKEEKWGRVGYVLSIGLLLYSDYLTYFILPVHIMFIFIFHRKILKLYILNLIIGFIFIIPWLMIFPKQFAGGQATAGIITGWKEVVGGASIENLLLLPIKIITGRINFDNNLSYVLTFVILAFPFILSVIKLLKLKQDFRQFLLWFWLILPPFMAFLISFFIPVFSYFRFIFILPAFYLLISVGLEKFNSRLSKMLVILIVLSGFTASSIYLFNPRFHREDWREAVGFVSGKADEQSLVIFENNEIPAPVRYYKSNLSNFKPGLSENLVNDLEGKDKIFLFEYLADIYDSGRSVEQKLQNLKFVNTKTYDFRGVGFIRLYEK